MPNRLAGEKSPYLLQHAQNPVDWYPWGEEAFARARAEDKPIFLSIGYSTCHWCHVMERESFENQAVADIMNALFVNVKVDREERPDVDRVYMTFVQATTGGGGWPMSVWLTPSLEPFYGGTYFPPKDAYGRPGFTTVLQGIARTWAEKKDEVLRSGAAVVSRLRELSGPTRERELLDASVLSDAARVFARIYDAELGGFGNAPKFPRPVTLELLVRQYARARDPKLFEMVEHTLRAMSQGGMYDHLGGGFHRYSVDRYWHVPHFEKMLYDQAQLVSALVEAWQLGGGDDLARVARETVDYVLRDLRDPATGAFWSAEDADSPVAPGAHERAEGAFYVFTAAEIQEVCGDDAAELCAAYQVEADGNADDPHGELTGKNVLHRDPRIADTPVQARARAALRAYRDQRPRPHLDDKVLTAWNALMIDALARGGAALGERGWIDAAARAADFLLATLWRPGEKALLRRFRAGEAAFDAHLEDHAALANALASLYEATFDRRWLTAGEAIVEAMNERFLDAEDDGWFATSGRDPSVLLRMKEDYDGAEPSGTSLATLACLRLGELTGRDEWLRLAERALSAASSRLRHEPHAMPLMAVAFDWVLDGATHVVVAGEVGDARTQALLAVAQRRFVPRRVLLLADEATRAAVGARLPWVAAMAPVDGAPAAYVCKGRACERPVTSPAALDQALLALAPLVRARGE